MYCSNCGKEISEKAKFCPECGTRQMSADDKTSEVHVNHDKSEYVRPEKVRFSERWLLVKIGIFQFFTLGFWMLAFEDGIDAVLYESDWIELIAAGILLALFNYFTVRALKQYGGNPYMLKIPVEDQRLIKIVKVLHYAEKGTDFLFIGSILIRGISNTRSYGFFSVYTWMEAVQHGEGWVILTALIWFAECMFVALHSINWWKKHADFEGIWSDDEKEEK